MGKSTAAQALVAVYPLQQRDYEGVKRAVKALRQADILMKVEGTHSTLVGSTDELFDAIREAFDAATETGPTTMTITVTNACALPVWSTEDSSDDET